MEHIDDEMLRVMVVVDLCVGLRASELLGMRWRNVDFEHLMFTPEAAVVRNTEGGLKSYESGNEIPIDPELAKILLDWYRKTEFRGPDDWVWASPYMAGEKPYFYTGLLDKLQAAASKAGLGKIGWHTLRHTYRTWQDETGAPVGVQQKLMRHSDIRTTMNHYGQALQESLRKAHGQVVKMALNPLNGLQTDCKAT